MATVRQDIGRLKLVQISHCGTKDNPSEKDVFLIKFKTIGGNSNAGYINAFPTLHFPLKYVGKRFKIYLEEEK